MANGGSRGDGTHLPDPRPIGGVAVSARAACRVLFIFAAPATRVRTLGEPTCGGATSARKVVTDRRRRGQQDPVKDLHGAVGVRLRIPGESPAPGGGSTPQVRIFDFLPGRTGEEPRGFRGASGKPAARRGAPGFPRGEERRRAHKIVQYATAGTVHLYPPRKEPARLGGVGRQHRSEVQSAGVSHVPPCGCVQLFRLARRKGPAIHARPGRKAATWRARRMAFSISETVRVHRFKTQPERNRQ